MPAPDSIARPSSEWRCSSSISSRLSGRSLVRMVSRMPILPTSCSSAACRSASRRSSEKLEAASRARPRRRPRARSGRLCSGSWRPPPSPAPEASRAVLRRRTAVLARPGATWPRPDASRRVDRRAAAARRPCPSRARCRRSACSLSRVGGVARELGDPGAEVELARRPARPSRSSSACRSRLEHALGRVARRRGRARARTRRRPRARRCRPHAAPPRCAARASERLVADRVAPGVVDLLEAVEVDAPPARRG